MENSKRNQGNITAAGERFFCHERNCPDGTFFFHFYPCASLVEFCGAPASEVVEVVVSEAGAGDESPYYAWHSYDDGKFHHIWPTAFQVDMCFPAGTKGAEQAGQGRLVNVVVRKVE